MFKYILIALSLMTFSYGEVKDLNKDVFGAATRNGIVVVEFWAGWNAANKLAFLDSEKIKDAKVYRLNVEKYPQIQLDAKVVVVPTLIFYDEGEEVDRIQGDLTFTLKITKKEIQAKIDEIILSKYN